MKSTLTPCPSPCKQGEGREWTFQPDDEPKAKRWAKVKLAGPQWLKLSLVIQLCGDPRGLVAMGLDTLPDLIKEFEKAMEAFDLDEIRFTRRQWRLLDELARDPRWNPALREPAPPAPSPSMRARGEEEVGEKAESGKPEAIKGLPFAGTCGCGWPLFPDGSCSSGECPESCELDEDWDGEAG